LENQLEAPREFGLRRETFFPRGKSRLVRPKGKDVKTKEIIFSISEQDSSTNEVFYADLSAWK
jgi:hypothetical protein